VRSFSAERLAIVTFAPAASAPAAVAKPIPELPPITRTFFPLRVAMGASVSFRLTVV